MCGCLDSLLAHTRQKSEMRPSSSSEMCLGCHGTLLTLPHMAEVLQRMALASPLRLLAAFSLCVAHVQTTCTVLACAPACRGHTHAKTQLAHMAGLCCALLNLCIFCREHTLSESGFCSPMFDTHQPTTCLCKA